MMRSGDVKGGSPIITQGVRPPFLFAKVSLAKNGKI